MVQMLLVAIPTYGLAFATEYWQYLIIGLFVGLAGGSFAIGIAYTSAWFPKESQGTAMGIFGAGNAGAAVTNLVAPTIVVVEAPGPFVGSTFLDALPYENVDLSRLYPYGTPPGR